MRVRLVGGWGTWWERGTMCRVECLCGELKNVGGCLTGTVFSFLKVLSRKSRKGAKRYTF